MLHDSFSRTIRYLRLSLTDACTMRCLYCRPSPGAPGCRPRLTADEIVTLVKHLVGTHGLQKVRLTGGEPTCRPDLLDIVRGLASIPGLDELAMTTNGLTLSRQASGLASAGLHRVNISLDSLDESRFRDITGVAGLERVLAGIEAAGAAGLTPVKLNSVVVRGCNDHELPSLLLFAADRGLEIRFIELMPMGPLSPQWAQRFVPVTEMRRRLDAVVRRWQPLTPDASAATRYRVTLDQGRTATLGLITAMSCPFCDRCDRVRVGADGSYYPCLMDHPAGSLLPALRPHWDAAALDRQLALGLLGKAHQHPASGVVVMADIGG